MPSADTCSATILRAFEGEALGELVEKRGRDIAHRGELPDAAMIDPMPELGDAHAPLARRDADLGERLGKLGSGRAGERKRRARGCCEG